MSDLSPLSESATSLLNNIRVISFDLDDTLWDCAPAIVHAESVLYEALKSRTPRITEQMTLDDLRSHRVAFGEAHREYAVDVTYMRTASLKALLSEFSYPRELATELFDIFYHARSQVTLYSDAVSVLESLSEHYALAALTNGNADLALIGIDGLFQDIQHASMTTPPKPARDMFDRAALKLAVTVDQILHIGDNPIADVGGAINAGARSVWFNQHNESWPDGQPAADFEVASLTELYSLLCPASQLPE